MKTIGGIVALCVCMSCESPFLNAKNRSMANSDIKVSSETENTSDVNKTPTSSSENANITSTHAPASSTQTLNCEKKSKKGDYCAELVFRKQPTLNQETTATLTFKNANGFVETILENHLKVEMGMRAHGHTSAAEVFEEKPGLFRIEGLFFTMPGQWQVRVKVVDESGQSVEEWEWHATI